MLRLSALAGSVTSSTPLAERRVEALREAFEKLVERQHVVARLRALEEELGEPGLAHSALTFDVEDLHAVGIEDLDPFPALGIEEELQPRVLVGGVDLDLEIELFELDLLGVGGEVVGSIRPSVAHHHYLIVVILGVITAAREQRGQDCQQRTSRERVPEARHVGPLRILEDNRRGSYVRIALEIPRRWANNQYPG
jgi:hypothetical protein